MDEREEALRELRGLTGGSGSVTLVYASKDEEHNIAIILADVLNSDA